MEKRVAESERISERAWYVVHTFSGYEKKVKATLESKIAAQGLEDVIFDVIVPMRDESEFKDGRRRIVKKKVFPGYVLVDMIVNNNSWFVVRNTQGVTGFVGSEKDPIPLSREEAERILTELVDGRAADDTLGFKANDKVRIIDGIFENRLGIVKSIDAEKQRLKVLVEVSSSDARQYIPVDLDVSQVEKIKD
ncbi:MAG: transcription termination/antitermination factor NusG [Selenomonadaceae bacterium]|nr:transcription termination/antitermination factor NusG [Selenomonadaceae bacterium]